MTDNQLEIDAIEYPLDVIYIPDKDGGYLIENGDKSKKYIPVSSIKTLVHSSLYLQIFYPVTYRFSVGEFYGTTFYTQAKLRGEYDSISFFGTDRKIKNIPVEIYPSKDELMQLSFLGEVSEKNIDIQEYIQISLAIPNSQFEGITKFWDNDDIGEAFLNLKKEILNGLYVLDSFAPDNDYKILTDKRIVKNHQDIPKNFTDFRNSKTYYVSNDCFKLSLIKKKFVHTKEDLSFNEDNFYEEETIHDEIGEKRLELLISKLDEIKTYIQYATAIIGVILIVKIKI